MADSYAKQTGNKIDWCNLSRNPNPNVIKLLKKRIEFENSLDENELRYIDLDGDGNKLDWYNLSENPNAIKVLEENPLKIKWESLSKNPNAIHILRDNQDNIEWELLSTNPAIFKPV